MVHFISKQISSPEDDFKHCFNNLFSQSEEDNKPRVLWSCYFSIPDTNNLDLKTGIPENVVLCSGPDLDLDYDDAVKKVQLIIVYSRNYEFFYRLE